MEQQDSFVANSKGGAEQALRVADEQRSAAANLTKDSRLTSSLTARPRPGETANAEVCKILIARLNQDGGTWSRCDCGKRKRVDEVDCTAFNADGKELKMQITRAAQDKTLWTPSGEFCGKDRDQSVNDAVEELRSAIKEKSRLPAVQKADLVLVLDAIETPGHVMDQIVNSFRKNYGTWLKALKFKQVWIVGPNESLTYRLDEMRP
jgi:hypothetical protein